MSETELEKRLIGRIQRSRNSALLREAYRLLGTDTSDPEPYKMTKEQRASVATGKKDGKEGRTPSASKASKAVDEWLGNRSGPRTRSVSGSPCWNTGSSATALRYTVRNWASVEDRVG
jgi:hypothetical protein